MLLDNLSRNDAALGPSSALSAIRCPLFAHPGHLVTWPPWLKQVGCQEPVLTPSAARGLSPSGSLGVILLARCGGVSPKGVWHGRRHPEVSALPRPPPASAPLGARHRRRVPPLPDPVRSPSGHR